MKRTQITELLANIRATAVSFFSIVMFVALGLGIFVGIFWSSRALYVVADNTFNNKAFHHFQIQFPYGVTEEDIQELSALEGIESVEPGYFSFQRASVEDRHPVIKVQSLPDSIDLLEVVEGTLPQTNKEIALLGHAAAELGITVGDSIAFAHDAEDSILQTEQGTTANTSGMYYLTNDEYTVTALVESSEYGFDNNVTYGYSTIGSGAIDCIGYVTMDTFHAPAFNGGYSQVNVRASIPDTLSTFDSEYDTQSDLIEKRINDLGEKRALARADSLRSQVEQSISEGQAQIDAGQAQIDEGQEKISEGYNLEKAGEEQLAEGEQKLVEAQKQIDEGEALYASAVEQFEQKKAEGEQQLSEAQALLEEGRATLDQAEDQLSSAIDQLAYAREALGLIDAATMNMRSFAETATSYKRVLEQLVSESTITQDQMNAILDAYGAHISETLQRALAQAGIQGITIPAISSATFDSSMAWIQNNLSNEIENISVPYNGSSVTISQLRTMVQEAPNQVSQGLTEVIEGEREYGARQSQYETARKEAQDQIAAAEAELAEKRKQIDSGKSQLDQGKAELDANKEKLASAEAELHEKEKELEQGKQKLADARLNIEEGRKVLESMKDFAWTVLPRSYNGGVAEALALDSITRNLAFSMALLFVVVGLLVSYSAVSRIVHEQVVQIGTKKALGLRESEITASFLAYATLAVIAGAIIGITAGVFIVEGIISGTMSKQFFFGPTKPYFSLPLALVTTLVELALILATTWFACHSILRKQAVELLRGEEPPSGKTRFFENWKIWKKLPLYTQTIVNNCLNDKRRAFSTIVGVAGCTALIVTAITLNDDVLESYNRHYSEVYNYDRVVYLEGEITNSDITRIKGVLESNNLSSTEVLYRRSALTPPVGGRSALRIVTPLNSDEFTQFYHTESVLNRPVDMTSNEFWLSQAYASHFDAIPGDQVVVDTGDGAIHKIGITGFQKFWLSHNEAVMTPSLYEHTFNSEPQANALFVKSNGMSAQDIESLLENDSSVFSVEDTAESDKKIFNTFSNISSTVVLVYLALAVLMAMVVLLNLNIMFINEKKRELIVLMINGFSVKDAKRYVYNDTIVLSIIGIIIGTIIGAIMGSYTIATIEPNVAYFVKDIAWRAVAIGVVGSAALSFIMAAIALRRVSSFNLTDINRA